MDSGKDNIGNKDMELEIQLPQEQIDRLMQLDVLVVNGRRFIEHGKVLSMLVKFYEQRNEIIEKRALDLYQALDEFDDIFGGNALMPLELQEKINKALINYEKFKSKDE